MREKSREAAFCGVLAALAETALLLGGVIPAATFCCPLLAMFLLLPVRSEFGTRAACAAVGAVALLALLLVPDRELAAVYCFFGWYPLLRPRLERLHPLLLRVGAKLLYCNGAITILYGLLIFLFRLEAVTAEFAAASRLLTALLLILGNAVFLIADRALGRLELLWQTRLRRRFFPGEKR